MKSETQIESFPECTFVVEEFTGQWTVLFGSPKGPERFESKEAAVKRAKDFRLPVRLLASNGDATWEK